MYSSVESREFQGLDMSASPDNAGCVDLLNVDFDNGLVRVRDGYDNLTSSAAASRYHSAVGYYRNPATRHVIAVRTSALDAIAPDGTVTASDTSALTDTNPTISLAPFGGPSATVGYVAIREPSKLNGYFKWSGSAWTAIAGPASEYPQLAAIQAADNRLVLATSAATTSRLRFSGAGTPETFGANDYVDLAPGDGEELQALVAWHDLLFAFKETKFFVFYGNTTDSAGNPVFNYRSILSASGAIAPQAVAVAPEGVYFCGRDGVYLTTGGAPRRISDPVEPIFTGRTSSFFQSSVLNQAQRALVATTYLNGCVYASYPSGSATTNDRTLKYDTKTGKWTLWTIPMGSISTFRVSDRDEIVFAYASGSNHIGRMNSSYTTDDGTAIVSRYRTGFSDLGTPGEKRPVSTRLWGTGTVDLKWSRDFESSLGTAQSYTLGTSPAIDHQVKDSKAKAGRLHSFQVGASSGAWVLHRADHEIEVLHGQNATST